MRIKREVKFKLESELCEAFMAQVQDRWDIYPEYHWDIFMVRKTDGVQVGLEAKLKLNFLVINQALKNGVIYPHYYSNIWGSRQPKPHYAGVLIPLSEYCSLGCYTCECLGLLIACEHGFRKPAHGDELSGGKPIVSEKRFHVPEFKCDTIPGKPSPKALTTWRISALKLWALYEKNGFLLSSDLKTLGVSPTWFIKTYMNLSDQRVGRFSKLIWNGTRKPTDGYESEYEQIKAAQ